MEKNIFVFVLNKLKNQNEERNMTNLNAYLEAIALYFTCEQFPVLSYKAFSVELLQFEIEKYLELFSANHKLNIYPHDSSNIVEMTLSLKFIQIHSFIFSLKWISKFYIKLLKMLIIQILMK